MMTDAIERVPETAAPQRTVVELEHWLFHKLEGVRFQLHQGTGQPGIMVTMAKNEAFLALAAVRKEFNIEGSSPDGVMLTQIANGLKYVKGLLLGDPLPKEILTGEASWKLTPTHLRVAHQRVAMRLITLVSADEPTTTDPTELLKMADDPSIKRKINEAFAVAAVELGMQPEQKQEVIEYVNTLAGELGYIEALRDKFDAMDRMREKIQAVRKMNSRKPTIADTADQVARLAERAKTEYAAIFADIDGRTSEILPLLRTLDSSIEFIRKIRDDLHVRFMAWDEILAEWAESHMEYSVKINDTLQRTHRFLAPRFMTFTDWTALARAEQSARRKVKAQPMSW